MRFLIYRGYMFAFTGTACAMGEMHYHQTSKGRKTFFLIEESALRSAQYATKSILRPSPPQTVYFHFANQVSLYWKRGEIRRFYLGWLENKIKFIDFNRTMTNSPWSVHKLKREAERNLNIFPPFLSPPSPGGAIRPKNHCQVIFWATIVGFSDFWCSTDAAKSWLLRF